MDKLVSYVTEEPKEEAAERKDKELLTLADLDVKSIPDREIRYRYANTACELLISDCPPITDKLASEDRYRDQIYAFLQSDAPFNPLLASFISKTMGILIARKSDMVRSTSKIYFLYVLLPIIVFPCRRWLII